MTKIFGGITVLLLMLIAGMSWHITRQETKITDQAELIGQKDQLISNYRSTIKSQNKEIDRLENDIFIRDEIALKSELAQQKIRSENSDLKTRLKDLQHENPEIQTYYNIVIPDDVYSLLPKQSDDGASGRAKINGGSSSLEIPDRNTETVHSWQYSSGSSQLGTGLRVSFAVS